jgi:hypothetical protein
LNSGPLLEPLHQPTFVKGFLWGRVSQTICQGRLGTTILLISASWVARITGMGHQCPACTGVLNSGFPIARHMLYLPLEPRPQPCFFFFFFVIWIFYFLIVFTFIHMCIQCLGLLFSLPPRPSQPALCLYCFFFLDGVFQTICLGWLQTVILPPE